MSVPPSPKSPSAQPPPPARRRCSPSSATSRSPITVNTFNYAPIAVVAVLVFSTVTWFVGGRLHFMRDVPKGHDTKPATEIFG